MAFGLFKRNQASDDSHPAPESVTIESPEEQIASQEKAAETITASGIDVGESIDQLKKFKKIHKWVGSLDDSRHFAPALLILGRI
jgi:hypothetical protein